MRVIGIDDDGNRHRGGTLQLQAGEAAHFNSDDLEDGNDRKALSGGTGSGHGDWHLELLTDLDIEVLSYVRGEDGFLTSMHDVAPGTGTRHWVAVFNPASNLDQQSQLRLINPGEREATVTITGIDDAGESPGSPVQASIAGGAALLLTASELETGAGLEGALGDGKGKWRLIVESSRPTGVMNLLRSASGHLANLSTVPVNGKDGVHRVPLFPAASDEYGRQGFVRVINRSGVAGEFRITAFDDTDRAYEPLTMALGANEAVHFNSDDLELGNEAKRLTGSTGPGTGDWYLEITGGLDMEVLSFVRHPDRFLTAMHDLAPTKGAGHFVAIFNPASNENQLSKLRLVNPGAADAAITITGTDDRGEPSEGRVEVSVPGHGSRTLTARQLESGTGVLGALGDRSGKWRLSVESDRPIQVMSLLESPTRHLTNLSTARGDVEPATE